MPSQKQQDNEVDFSNYFKKNSGPARRTPAQAGQKITNRMVIAILLLIALAVIEGYLLYQRQEDTMVQLPEGYQWVTNPNGPASIAPIKK